MSRAAAIPLLELGSVEAIDAKGNEGIVYDEAVIFLAGEEESEIRIKRPNALALAEQIVLAGNSHAKLIAAVRTLLPCAAVAAELLAAAGKPEEAAKIAKVEALSQQFLADAGAAP